MFLTHPKNSAVLRDCYIDINQEYICWNIFGILMLQQKNKAFHTAYKK